MLDVLVVLLSERLLGERQKIRIGWMASLGSVVMFAGVMWYLTTNSPAGRVLAEAGLVIIGISYLATSWWGLYDGVVRLWGARERGPEG